MRLQTGTSFGFRFFITVFLTMKDFVGILRMDTIVIASMSNLFFFSKVISGLDL